MGGYGIVGGNLPIAAGIGLASDYLGEEDVTLCMFGDGASNQGTFGETLNLAALWRLPVVFMVTNNQFGMGTALQRHSAVTDLQRKGESLGVPGVRCDGMDVLDTHAVVAAALAQVREERRPVLVEAVTYRFRGHSMADPEEYRSKEEVAQWRERDPIPAFGELLEREGVLDAQERAAIDEHARARVDAAVAFAEASPFPAPESLYDDVYVLGDQVQGWYSVGRPSRRDGASPDGADGADGADGRERRSLPRRSRRRCRPARKPDGRAALPRGAERGPARGARARRARDPDGRGHRRLRRRLQSDRGPAGRVRRATRARHADLREHDRRDGRRGRDGRAAAGGRADDDQLRAARVRPDRQPRGPHPLHVRRASARAAGGADAAGRGPPAGADALALPGGALHARAGPARRDPLDAGRREGPAEGGDPRRQPGDLHRARVALRPARRGPRRPRTTCSASGAPPCAARAPT